MTPPSVSSIVAAVVCATLAAMFAVGVATQPRTVDREPEGHRIEGLVLDGSGVTTTAPSSLGRPVEPIPHRDIEGADQ